MEWAAPIYTFLSFLFFFLGGGGNAVAIFCHVCEFGGPLFLFCFFFLKKGKNGMGYGVGVIDWFV